MSLKNVNVLVFENYSNMIITIAMVDLVEYYYWYCHSKRDYWYC